MDDITEWISTNPGLTGVNWTSALELSLRIINWTAALSFISESVWLSKDIRQKVLLSIRDQANYIARHLSAYSSANNHLIGEAAGLAVAGICFPNLPEADRWRDTGISILESELSKQILVDGVSAEQAIEYLAFVLDFNLLVWQLVKISDEQAVPAIWYERLDAACTYLMYMMDEVGNVPHIGDGDNAWVVRLDDSPLANNYKSILASGAAILQRADLKTAAGVWDEKSHWLLGDWGRTRFESLPTRSNKLTSKAFPQGGYWVLRTHDRHIVFDCGPLGYLTTAAHGHADALSLVVSVSGEPILIDPGTYAYQEGGAWRDFLRSTRAHNTVTINGLNQSENLGTFLWGRKAKSDLLFWHTDSEYDLVIGHHDGYSTRGTVHRRSVFFHKPDWLLVIDDILGDEVCDIEQTWHLPPNGQASIEGNIVTMQVSTSQIRLHALRQTDEQIRLVTGQESPYIQGWVSNHYGHIAPAPTVCISVTGKLPRRLVTAIALSPQRTTDEHERAEQMLHKMLLKLSEINQ